MTTLNISEIFRSIQGEGSLMGVISNFVRLAGCDLSCRWCDTAYAKSPSQGKPMTIDQVIAQLAAHPADHVVITGGEPLLAPQLAQLLDAIKQRPCHITLETAATSYCPLNCDLVSISPKLSNSDPTSADLAAGHKQKRLNIPAIQSFIDNHDCQLKFVVQSEADLPEINQLLDKLRSVDRQKVMLMPQAKTKTEHQQLSPLVAELCIKNNFRFSPRLHIIIWDQKRGV